VALVAVAAAFAFAVPLAPAAEIAAPGLRPRIVNGLPTNTFATVGALLSGPDAATADHFCSGTLIGCRTFLTAAHCIGSDFDPSHYGVFLQDAGVFAVAAVAKHPDSDTQPFPIGDVAVVTLASPVQSILPSAINQAFLGPYAPFPSQPGTIVGFGQTMAGANDFNLKRMGKVQTATCGQTPGPPFGGDDELVCWRFDKPVGIVGEDSNTCNGDSGGPIFLDLGSGPVVAGVTSGGANFTCLNSDLSYDANVEHYKDFLLGALSSDSTSACGSLPVIGQSGSRVVSEDGYLGAFPTQRIFQVPLAANTGRIVFTFNGRNPNSGLAADFDLYVRHGLPPTTSDFDCATVGPSQLGDCRFDNPAGGTWYALVRLVQGEGDFQFNATALGGDTPVCGNGIREPDEDCDLGDDTNCPGSCDVSCICPKVCTPGSVEVRKLVTRTKRLAFKARLLDDVPGASLMGLDPRASFSAVLSDGVVSLDLSVPDFDRGWKRSKPEKGRYKWKGNVNGIRRVRIFDRVAARGFTKVVVIASGVSGATALAVATTTSEVDIDGTCVTE